MLLLAGLAVGLLLGALLAWLYSRSETAALGAELAHERARTEEKVALLEEAKTDFAAKFDALAADALRKNNESFLELASVKVRPIEESLKTLPAAAAAPEPEREAYFADYIRQVRTHARQLSEKAYWEQFAGDSPDYVLMFLPGEGFFRTAIERDPSLLELAGGRRVILVSPMMLITLLRTIACIWSDAKVAESAQKVGELGRELYERLTTMTDHFVKLGDRLDGAVQEYNRTVGS